MATNAPRDGNRVPTLLGVDSSTGLSSTATIDHATGGLDINIVGGGSTGDVQYTDAGAAATHPTGTGIIFNNAGTYNFVSEVQPLPVLASIAAAQTIAAVTAITDALPAGTNNIGSVTTVPTAGSGWSFNFQSALTATKAQIKATTGTFGGYITLYNPNTAVTFIQVFNKPSSSVTVGTTAADFVIVLPGLATAAGTGTDRNLEIVNGVAMSTGITVAATTTPTGNTSPSSSIVATFLFV